MFCSGFCGGNRIYIGLQAGQLQYLFLSFRCLFCPLLKMLLTYDNCVCSSCLMYFLHSSSPRSYCKTINCWELWGEVFWFVFGALSHRFYWSWFGHQIGLPVQLQPFKRCLDIIMAVTLHHITLACTLPQARWIQLINQVMLTCAFEVPILSFTGRFSHTRRMQVLSCILVYNREGSLALCLFRSSLLTFQIFLLAEGEGGEGHTTTTQISSQECRESVQRMPNLFGWVWSRHRGSCLNSLDWK